MNYIRLHKQSTGSHSGVPDCGYWLIGLKYGLGLMVNRVEVWFRVRDWVGIRVIVGVGVKVGFRVRVGIVR